MQEIEEEALEKIGLCRTEVSFSCWDFIFFVAQLETQIHESQEESSRLKQLVEEQEIELRSLQQMLSAKDEESARRVSQLEMRLQDMETMKTKSKSSLFKIAYVKCTFAL
jgi:hypothetical protein